MEKNNLIPFEGIERNEKLTAVLEGAAFKRVKKTAASNKVYQIKSEEYGLTLYKVKEGREDEFEAHVSEYECVGDKLTLFTMVAEKASRIEIFVTTETELV